MTAIARILLSTALVAFAPWAAADSHGPDAVRAALDSPDRPDADKARDADRKPAEVVSFLGIEEGMTVMDIIAAGGYYTEVLSRAVGEDGTVYAQNPPAVLAFRDGANDKAMTERLADERLPNVQRVDADFADLDLPAGSVDAAITALNFHDVYNRDPQAAQSMLETIHTLLVPGGVLGIIDHAGDTGADNASLHRVEKSKAIETAQAAGFELAGESDLLANPEDDRTQGPFTEGLRGKTDRFLLKLTKPE